MNKLLIVWSTEEIEVAKKMVLLYGSVILPRAYWDEAHLMIWGPSARVLAENRELQQMLKASQFNVLSVDHGPPIIIVAERPMAVHNAA